MRRNLAVSVLGVVAALLASVLVPPTTQAAETLLSRGKPATASSIEASGFEARNAVDGDTSTRWASLEDSDPEWIQVDLGSAQPITRVKPTWEVAFAKSYQVRISTDGSSWTTAYSTTSGDARSLTAARKLNSWIKAKTGGDPSSVATGYRLNGAQLESGNQAAHFAPFAVAAMTASGNQAWLDALWDKMLATPIATDSYFSASIQLQVMITVTHNHWVP